MVLSKKGDFHYHEKMSTNDDKAEIDKFLTVGEAAKLLGMTRKTAHRHVVLGENSHHRDGHLCNDKGYPPAARGTPSAPWSLQRLGRQKAHIVKYEPKRRVFHDRPPDTYL